MSERSHDVNFGNFSNAAHPGDLYATTVPARFSRVSWGAIFAGFAAAMGVQIILGLLGLSIGLVTIQPTHEQNPLAGLGTGAVIWWIATTIIALIAGGWVAGRLAGVPRVIESAVHGVLAWSLLTIFSALLITSAVGGMLSGAVNLVGHGLAAVGYGASGVATAMNAGGTNSNLSALGANTGLVPHLTGRPAAAEEVRREAQELVQQGRTGTTGNSQTGGANAGTGGQDAVVVVNRFIRQLETGNHGQVERESVVNVLTSQAELSEQEARQTVNRWEQRLGDAASGPNMSTTQQVKEKAAQVTERVSGTLASAAFWSFAAMLLGAVSAAVGGWLGTPGPRSPVTARDRTTTTNP
jgi:hypothetical protein